MDNYLALFEPDQKAGGYVVTFPDFGYGATQGETDREAVEMARDLLMLTIADFMREGRPLPVPRHRQGTKYRPVQLTALQAAKVDLYTAFLKSGLKKAELARRVGIPKDAYRPAVLPSASLPFGSDRVGICRPWQAPACRGARRGLKPPSLTRIAGPASRPLCWRARPECSRPRRRQPQAPPLPERAWPGPRG